MDTLWQDFRFALRSLRKHWSITLLAGVSLALAIAGNTVVFSLINGLLYRPLPFPEADRILLLGETEAGASTPGGIAATSEPVILEWQESVRSLSKVAAFTNQVLAVDDGDRVESSNSALVSPALFDILGTEPFLGRLPLPEEGRTGSARVVLLTHETWTERYAADETILTRTLDLDGEPHAVIGVLPPDFEFLDPTIELVAAAPLDPDASRDRRYLVAVARLAPGVSEEQAEKELAALETHLAERYPEAHRGYEVAVVNLRHELPDSTNRQLFALLQGALLFVLMIACANIANLLLARGRKRSREMAIRSSLGAGGHRIVRQLLTENLLLSLVAGLAGLGLGWLGVRAVNQVMATQLPKMYQSVIDGRVLAFTLGVTVLAGLLFGVAPALQTRKLNLTGALKDGGRGADSGSGKTRASNALVVAEIALALVLLAGSAVLIRSFLDLQHRDPGFETAHLLSVPLNLPDSRYETSTRLDTLERMGERVGGLPGVTSVAISNGLPRSPFNGADTFQVDAAPTPEDVAPPRSTWIAGGPAYFDTVGIDLLQGRRFDSTDRTDGLPVALVNQTLAQRHWPDGSPLGEQITLRGTSRRVVGVVEDVQHGFLASTGPQPVIYIPFAQWDDANPVLLVRTENDPGPLKEPLRQAILAVDPQLAVDQIETVDEFLAQFFVGTQLFTTILGGFGFIALLLAVLGTYGVLAYTVALRTHEIGVRMAMGAERRQIVGMMTTHGLKLAFFGILVGLPGVWLVVRAIASTVEDFATVQPAVVLGIAALLAAVTGIASLVPALRAASIDPRDALYPD